MDASHPESSPRPIFTSDELIRAARGELIMGLTTTPGETPLGRKLAGTFDFWTPFCAARRDGYIVLPDHPLQETLGTIWRTWAVIHKHPAIVAKVASRFKTWSVVLDPPPDWQWSPAFAVLIGKILHEHSVVLDSWYLSATHVRVLDLAEGSARSIASASVTAVRDPRSLVPRRRWQEPERIGVFVPTRAEIDPGKLTHAENDGTPVHAAVSALKKP